jgi:hypothetical protein
MSDLLSKLRMAEMEKKHPQPSASTESKFDFNGILNGNEKAWNDLKAESGVTEKFVAPIPKKIIPSMSTAAGGASTANALPAASLPSVCLLMPTDDLTGIFNFYSFQFEWLIFLAFNIGQSSSSSRTTVPKQVIFDLQDENTCHWSFSQNEDAVIGQRTSSESGKKAASSKDTATSADQSASPRSGRSSDEAMKEYAMLCTVNDYFSFSCSKGKYNCNYYEILRINYSFVDQAAAWMGNVLLSYVEKETWKGFWNSANAYGVRKSLQLQPPASVSRSFGIYRVLFGTLRRGGSTTTSCFQEHLQVRNQLLFANRLGYI